MVVLIDVDGVLVDFIEGLRRGLEKHFRIPYEDTRVPKQWDMRDLGATRKEIEHVVNRPNFCYNLPAIAAGQELLGSLRLAGHRVIAATSPWDNWHWAGERYQDLQLRFGFREKDIVIGHDKTLLGGDILIDDALKNVQPWAASGRTAILIEQPYNRYATRLDGRLDMPGTVMRCDYSRALQVVAYQALCQTG